MTSSFRIIAGAGLALLLAVSVSGCGRRGSLEPPPGSTAAADRAKANEDAEEAPTMPKGGGLIKDFTPGTTPSTKPKKPAQKPTPPAASDSNHLDPLL